MDHFCYLCLVFVMPRFWTFLDMSITNGIVSSKIYDKRDDFNFEKVNFPFLDGDVPRCPSYGVYISQQIGFKECVLMLMTSTKET